MAEPAFLLDSNICIYVLEGRGRELRDRIEACSPGEIVTSSIVFAEVSRGLDLRDRKRVESADKLFAAFPIQPFDRAAAERYRDVPFSRGRFDRLIAAHALALGVTVITSNLDDFADVPGLRVEDWTR